MVPSQKTNRSSQQSTSTTASGKSKSSSDTLGQVYSDYSTRNQSVPPQRQTATFGPSGGPQPISRPSSSGKGKVPGQSTPPVSRNPSLTSLPGGQPLPGAQSGRTSASSSLYAASSTKSNTEGGLRDPAQVRKDADAAKAVRLEAESRERQRKLTQYLEFEYQQDDPFKAVVENSSSSQSTRRSDKGKRMRPEDRQKK